MTDDIKVGDRLKFPEVLTVTKLVCGTDIVRVAGEGVEFTVPSYTLAACQRLPPEIGVGDEVRTPDDDDSVSWRVLGVDGKRAWIAVTQYVGGPVSDRDHGAGAYLSDLSLVKKAEKD